MRVAASLEIERKKIQEQEETIAKLQTELKGKEVFIKTLSDQLETRESEVSFLSQKLREVSADYKLGDPAKDIKTFREEKVRGNRQIQKLVKLFIAFGTLILAFCFATVTDNRAESAIRTLRKAVG